MEKLIVTGKKKISGVIKISGSKNATLPILASSILSKKKVEINRVPIVKDVLTMVDLLKYIGSKIKFDQKKNKIIINNQKKKFKTVAPYKLLKTMRAGIIVLGPLLSRFKKAKVSLPGGCAIGSRPVDIHLFVLKKLGAKIKIENGYIIAEAKSGLIGKKFRIPSISVGATENAIIAASYAKGTSYISNCACEPEIKDLTIFLRNIGAKITWIGKRKIKIKGNQNYRSTKHEVMFDRIEAGTYLIAAALAGTKIKIRGIQSNILKKEIFILKKMGIKFKVKKNEIVIFKTKTIKPISLRTEPYPGFPTDLQAQIMVLMNKANGISKIKEKIFEKRFMHVPELNRMGSKIKILGDTSFISGPQQLNGAEVMATDLRASVSLVLAGLDAKGKTVINRVYHLDRGYENLEKKLRKCNAKIFRAK